MPRVTDAACPSLAICTALLLVALGACVAPAPEETAAPGVVIFTGATLIDGTGGEPVQDAALVVREGRIECVGSSAECPAPGDARIVDLSGTWVTPGLVDAHVHFAQTAWADGRPDGMDVTGEYPYAQVVARQKREVATTYRSYLCSGVTAVFDVGGFPWSWELRDDAEEGLRIPAGATGRSGGLAPPHVAAAGPLLTWVPARMSLPAEQVMVQIDDEEEGRRAAHYIADFGSDAVKVWFLGVPEDSAAAPLPTDIDARVRAIGDAARERGVPLIVHATGLREAKVAVRAGAHLLVHSVSDQAVDEEFLELAREQGTIYTPTLIVGENWSAMYEHAVTGETPTIDDPAGCVDPATRDKILSTPEYGDHPSLARFTEEVVASRRRSTREENELMAANLRRVHEAGITVAMGTDAGNPFTVHGPSVHAEMERMQAAGVEPADIIVMSTRNGARAMGRDDEIGTLEVGKVADFLILDADPLADVTAFRSLRRVGRAGRLAPVSELAFPDTAPPEDDAGR